MKLLFAIVAFLIAASICTTCTVKEIQFTQNCKGYLKRAADANTIEIAKEQLNKALAYIEEKQYTAGYTSIIFKTPDEDVAFWYNNLKSSVKELNDLSTDVSPLERSNMLIKLRETLLDNAGETGTKVTYPDGIPRYPDNMGWALLNTLQICFWVLGIVLIILHYDDY